MTVLTDIVVPWASLFGIVVIVFGVGKWVQASRGRDERQDDKTTRIEGDIVALKAKTTSLNEAREEHGTRLTLLEAKE